MTDPTHEVLLLCDRFHDDSGSWHLYPRILDVSDWWPDGSPAWVDSDVSEEGEHRIVIEVIPMRQPDDSDDDGWVEDSPRVLRLIDLVMTLNDIFLPWGNSDIAAACAAGDVQAHADAILARIRKSFTGEDIDWVFAVGMQVESARKLAASA